MKVLALSDSLAPWHSFWIRVGQYLPAFRWDTEISNDPDDIESLQRGDTLIVYRYNPGWGNLSTVLYNARRRGVLIISDLDDYLWQAKGWSRERLRGYTIALRECQILTCSTEALLEQIKVMFPGKKLYLIENTSPRTSQPLRKHSSKRIQIGWTGAPWTRPEDLSLLTTLASWIATQSKNVQLVHIGHGEGRLSFASALGLRDDMVIRQPLQGHSDYMQKLTFDIGLAPLSTTSFNRYKSAIKVIEYSTAGIPWIASDSEPYRNLCKKWNWYGRLCQHPTDWIDNLIPLLNEAKRKQEGDRLRQLCSIHSNYQKGVEQWSYVIASHRRQSSPD